MKISKLIELLKEYPQDAEIYVYSPDIPDGLTGRIVVEPIYDSCGDGSRVIAHLLTEDAQQELPFEQRVM